MLSIKYFATTGERRVGPNTGQGTQRLKRVFSIEIEVCSRCGGSGTALDAVLPEPQLIGERLDLH